MAKYQHSSRKISLSISANACRTADAQRHTHTQLGVRRPRYSRRGRRTLSASTSSPSTLACFIENLVGQQKYESLLRTNVEDRPRAASVSVHRPRKWRRRKAVARETVHASRTKARSNAAACRDPSYSADHVQPVDLVVKRLPFSGRLVALTVSVFTLLAPLAILAPLALADERTYGAADLIATLQPAVVNITIIRYLRAGAAEGNMAGQAATSEQRTQSSWLLHRPVRHHRYKSAHVVQDASEIIVTLHDTTKLRASVLAAAAQSDLALLRAVRGAAGKAVSTVSFGDKAIACGRVSRCSSSAIRLVSAAR